MGRNVTMGLLFYPRGGSAQVIKYLAAALAPAGWDASIVCGTLGEEGGRTHAPTFFDGLDVVAADYTPAVAAYEHGRDPIAVGAGGAQPDPRSAEHRTDGFPMHPSFEDRAGVPDRVFSKVAPELGEHLVASWSELIGAQLQRTPEVLHLHHLTPLQDAFERTHPGTPLVTHLHGTDLKMIDRIETGEDSGPHGPWWVERMRAGAARSDHFIVISPHDRDEARRLLDPDAEVTWIPNGDDTTLFDRRPEIRARRIELWREWLTGDDARGWDESGEPGSIRYTDADLAAFEGDAPVLLFVGRFLDFKRVPMLVRAYARAQERFERRAPLVIWGGFPGEWEGEHPHTVALEAGVKDVFFTGWRGHEDLADGLSCADVMVAPSHNEPFGQVFLEAMAAGVPVIATRSGGPLSFVNTDSEPNGWMVAVDDEAELAAAMVEAVNDDGARRTRAGSAYEQIRRSYSWSGLAGRFADVYETAIRRHPG